MTEAADGPRPGRWHDLRTRALSAAVLVAVGGVEIWLGGMTFMLLAVAVSALMLWELARITAPQRLKTARTLALAGLAALLGALELRGGLAPAASPCARAPLRADPAGRDRRISAAYAAAVDGGRLRPRHPAGRGRGGPRSCGWSQVVVASDVLGYFVGRLVGGPKFWPALSPKKTWSGTVAGWAGRFAWRRSLSRWGLRPDAASPVAGRGLCGPAWRHLRKLDQAAHGREGFKPPDPGAWRRHGQVRRAGRGSGGGDAPCAHRAAAGSGRGVGRAADFHLWRHRLDRGNARST